MKDSRMFDELESSLGGLSPVQRILLGTDGSVTSLLELVTGSPVSVNTLTQEIRRADERTAAALDIRAGDEINHRIVELKNSRTGEVLIYAVSDTPLSRLSPEFREDLMKADIPIGRILSKYKMESRREIMEMKVIRSDAPMNERFGLSASMPFLSRKYCIIHRNNPLICIEESFPSHCFREGKRILVDAPSRLHLGLIDLNGALGRVDGGMGITLDNPRIMLSAEYSEETLVEGPSEEISKRVAQAAESVYGALNLPGKARIKIHEGFPQHIGLGSGTQYALAACSALCELYGADPGPEKLAMLAGRGGTSGIGTAAFAEGGFLIDCGHRFGPTHEKQSFLPSSASRGVRPAPVMSRHHFPEDWKILVIMPSLPGGASGIIEKDIFQHYCPVPLGEVQALCHEIMMRLIPGLVEEDLDMFGTALNRVQTLGFKKIELSLQPPEITAMIEDLRASGAAAAGLSSFGPVVYAIGDGPMKDLETVARDSLLAMGGGDWCVTSARNKGASIITA